MDLAALHMDYMDTSIRTQSQLQSSYFSVKISYDSLCCGKFGSLFTYYYMVADFTHSQTNAQKY